MKKFSGFFMLIPICLFGQTSEREKGIHFEHGTFTEVLAKAKKENKIIFVDAFTTWCGPCKWMAKNTFPNDTIAEFYNKNFINAKIDMEKGEGIDIAKKYQVMCYPTLLYIDGNGQLLHRQSGGLGVKEFMQLGTDAMNPVKQFASCKKKYNSGNSTPDEIGEYLLMRGRTCLPVKDEMAKYFSTQKDADLTSQRNWTILSECRTDIRTDSREFNYLVNHRAEFEKLYTPEKVSEIIKNSYSFALYNYSKEKNTEGYNKLREEIVKKSFPFSDEMVLNADMSLYENSKDWTNYAKTAVAYIDKYAKENHNMLNNVAWSFYENISDKAMLVKAEEWAKHSIELSPGYFNYDTYTALLYKLGKKSEAQAAAEKAIELAKQNGDDCTATSEMLEKIKAMK